MYSIREVGLLYRLRTKLDKKELIIIGDGLILSKIRYCLSIIGSRIRTNELERVNFMMHELQLNQNNVMRTILKVKLSDKMSIAKLLQSCGWLSVNQTAIKTTLLEARKVIKFNVNPDILNDMTKYYTRDTRAASKGMFAPDLKTCSTLVLNASKLLNHSLFEKVKYCDKISEVKSTIKKYISKMPI